MVDINYDNLNKRPKFGSLSRGVTFVYGDELYMVIEPCRVDIRDDKGANAIKLSDGSYEDFGNGTLVTPVDIYINVRKPV